MSEKYITNWNDKKTDVKFKEVKSNKDRKKHILSLLLIILFIIGLIGFTTLNYMVHVNEYEGMFNSPPNSETIVSLVKPLILKNSAEISNDSLNELIAYEVQTNIKSYINLGDIRINGVSLLFIGENKAEIFIKLTGKSTVVISSELDFRFDKNKQELSAVISNVHMGKLKLPNTLWKHFLSELDTKDRLNITDNHIILSVSLSEGETSEYIPKISELYIKNGKLTITIDKVFEKGYDLLYNILGDKATSVIETVIDTVIKSDNEQKPYKLLYKCVRELYDKFETN